LGIASRDSSTLGLVGLPDPKLLDLACPQDPKDLGLEIAANLKSLLKIFFLYDIPKHKYLGLSGAPYSSTEALNPSNLNMTSPDQVP